jgi:hypothetical protein
MAVASDEDLPYGTLVGGGFGQGEGRDDAPRSDGEADLEAVDPLGLGGAPPEARLPREQPVPACPDANDRWDEGGIQDMVDHSLLGEEIGQMKLEGSHFALQSPHPAVENWLWEGRVGKYPLRWAEAKRQKSLSLLNRGH